MESSIDLTVAGLTTGQQNRAACDYILYNFAKWLTLAHSTAFYYRNKKSYFYALLHIQGGPKIDTIFVRLNFTKY